MRDDDPQSSGGLRALAGVGLLVAAGMASAAEDAPPSQIDQRIRLTAQLIGDSPAAQRILASGNQQAVSNLEAGRAHLAQAQDLLAKGDQSGALRLVDEALRHVAVARRLVPDAPSRQAAARQRFEVQSRHLESMLGAWRVRLAPGDADDRELVEAHGLMRTALGLAHDGRHEEANQVLQKAERQILSGMSRLLNQRTLDYTARPTTPAEAFQVELARHRELADLVPIALHDLKPDAEATTLIARYQETSQTLRNQALQRFEGGQTEDALAHLRNALLYLQRALNAAGVTTPEPTGSIQ